MDIKDNQLEELEKISHIDIEKYEHLFNYAIEENKIKLSITLPKEVKSYLGLTLRVSEEASWKAIKELIVTSKRCLIARCMSDGHLS